MRRNDLTGKRFGMLVGIKDVGSDPKTQNRIWLFRCDCGNEARINTTSILKVKSCGCKKARAYDDIYQNVSARVFFLYRTRSNKKGYRWNLTRDEVQALIFQDCYYCGAKPSNSFSLSEVSVPYNGIDRRDNTEGYVPGNVVPCCSTCNIAKSTQTTDDFKKWIERVCTRIHEGAW